MKTFLRTLSFFLGLVLVTGFAAETIHAKESALKTVAILPFETNTNRDISYIIPGITRMLHSRLAWKDKVAVIPVDQIRDAVATLDDKKGVAAVTRLGNYTKSDYVISGIITEFSGAFSIDLKVYDLNEKTVLTFFDQSDEFNRLIPKFDLVAAKINKKVFDRTTVSYEKYKEDKMITEEELRRMNPEKMLPPRPSIEAEDKPWWKIW